MTKQSHRFFENKACKYYPCHELTEINCLFCYCPLFHMSVCPGMHRGTNIIEKDCANCNYPHDPSNYDDIIKLLGEQYEVQNNSEQ